MSVFDRLGADPDPAVVRDEMIALKEPERRRRAKAAEEAIRKLHFDRGDRQPPRQRAVLLEWVGTTTARKIATEFWRIGLVVSRDAQLEDDVYAVLAARGRAFFTTLARGLLRSDALWGSWTLVRRAVREGLIEQPDGDDYLRQLVTGVAPGWSGMHELDSVYRGLLSDPSLLEREVWELFEVDASLELAGANTWEAKDDAKPQEYSRGDNRWLYALSRLADEGRLDRERLLDASLEALMRDFRASSVGWYAKLHEELAPSEAERLARLDRYLALVTSPVPAVVKEGLNAVRELEDVVPADAFARVAPTPFTFRQKNLSMETLTLLGRLCERRESARPQLLGAAAQALGHERGDVQEKALKLLETYPSDVPRAELLVYVDAVAPTLRPRVEALTGVAAPASVAENVEIRPPVQPRLTWETVRATRAELVPVESVDELIELAAALLEGQGDGDDCERLLDGVSRLSDRRGRELERRTAGLAKRAESMVTWNGVSTGGAEVIGTVVRAWARRVKPRPVKPPQTVLGFLAARAEDVAKRATRGPTRPLLAFPTHSGGWIDPGVLEERERATGRLFNRPDASDRLQARARALAEVERPEYRAAVAETTRWGVTNRRFRLDSGTTPSGLGELGPLVARAGALEDATAWYGPPGWAGMDALGVRWALTVIPTLPEVAFAGAALSAVEAREGSAYHHPEVVLEHALDAHVPLGDEAWLATAACLVAKSPELPRVAADLLVASIEDGRFDARPLGQSLAWLTDNDFAKLNRVEAPLRDVARVSPLHGAQVVRIVEGVLGSLKSTPRTLHSLLEIAVEAATATGRRITDDPARAAIGRLVDTASPSSKLGKLARSLQAM